MNFTQKKGSNLIKYDIGDNKVTYTIKDQKINQTVKIDYESVTNDSYDYTEANDNFKSYSLWALIVGVVYNVITLITSTNLNNPHSI